jgi:hypothetical protein
MVIESQLKHSNNCLRNMLPSGYARCLQMEDIYCMNRFLHPGKPN